MKTEPAAVHAFATLRFSGDKLDPEEINHIVPTSPTLAYRKGDLYPVANGRKQRGKTGLWYVTTRGRHPDDDLGSHLRTIAELIATDPSHPERDERLHRLRTAVQARSLRQVVTVFWHGPAGAPRPALEPWFKNLVRLIDGRIDEDFQAAEQDSGTEH